MNLRVSLKPWVLAALTACTGLVVSTSASWAACGVVDPANQPVPVASTHVQPPYPMISQRLGEQGVTVLQVEIDEHGSVIDDYVRRSSGSDRLDHAALIFVKENWRWQPPSTRCRPIAAVTVVEVGWSLTRDHSEKQTENSRPLPPFPTSFYSAPEDRQKLALARYLIAQLHRAQPQREKLDLMWAPAEARFRERLAALPDAQRQFAIAAFENTLDEAFNERRAEVDAKFTKDLTDSMDAESMKALVEFYATPLGQKSLVNRSEMTQGDRHTMGTIILAHPGALGFSVAGLRMVAGELKTMKQNNVEFVQKFQRSLCAKLASFDIRDPDCSASPRVSPSTLEGCASGQCAIDYPAKQPQIIKSASRDIDAPPTSAAPTDLQALPIAQPPDDGCSASEREIAETARQNGYRYTGVCH